MNPTLKYLLQRWLLLLVLSEVSCFLILQLWHKIPDEPMQQEYRRMLIMLSILATSIMCASAITIFLNLAKRVRTNIIYQWLSFFLLPLILCYISINPMNKSFEEGWLINAPIMLPFFIWLTLGYILFSKWLKNQPKS